MNIKTDEILKIVNNAFFKDVSLLKCISLLYSISSRIFEAKIVIHPATHNI
jgi:hypothetical protein